MRKLIRSLNLVLLVTDTALLAYSVSKRLADLKRREDEAADESITSETD